MLHKFHKSSLKFWRRITLFLLVGLCGLVTSNGILIFLLSGKEHHWLIIPQSAANNNAALSSKGFSDVYLTQWADSLSRSLLTVNPYTVEERLKNALTLTSSKYYGQVASALQKESEEIKRHDLSTAFYPRDFSIQRAQNLIEVKGVFHTYFGKDKAPVVEEKTWIVGWERGVFGACLLTRFNQKGSHS